MSKIYLCGITNNQYDNVKALTDPIYEHIDGLIWVYHKSDVESDGTLELLEERKGCGEVIVTKWVNAHDHSMNKFLIESVLKEGDWFILRDSMERFNSEWAKDISQFLTNLDLNKIRSVYNYGKGFAFKWNDSMFFQGSPHWGLNGVQHKMIELQNHFSEEKKEHTWRIKDGEVGGRPIDNKIDHEAKYSWVYGRSNHLYLGVDSSNHDEFQRAELIRLHTRDLARSASFKTDMDGLKSWIKFLGEKDFEALRIFINSHRVWKNFYRYHFLKHDFSDIEATEKSWQLI